MATISADGRTFLVNNKRLWLVGGEVGYRGIPRSLWRERLARAADAGLNTIVVPVAWSAHEPIPERFDFEADRDLAAFCRMAGEAGLWVVLRVGPFVGGRESLGGIPPWAVSRLDENELARTASPGFLSATTRWLRALCDEIEPLQVTRSGDDSADARQAGNPLLAVQVEHHWLCGDDTLAKPYFDALTRSLREGGVTVPILTLNNMFAQSEGAIEAWGGYANLHTVVRQLHEAWPDEPPIVGELEATTDLAWGDEVTAFKTPRAIQRSLCETLAACGQFFIGGFAPGAPRAFGPGQFTHRPGAFAISSPPRDFIAEDGSVGAAFGPARRVCLFADSFWRVFAGADPDSSGAVITPSASAPRVVNERTGERAPGKPEVAGVTIEHVRGAAGSVVFLFSDDTKKSKQNPVPLTIPGGMEIVADVGALAVSWVVVGTHLFGDKTLDYCTLPLLTRAGRTLVVFGSAKSTGSISVNGSTARLTVPTGRTPAVTTVDGVCVVVVNESTADATRVRDGIVHVGAASFAESGEPVRASGFSNISAVDVEGEVTTLKGTTWRNSKRITLNAWSAADASEYVSGSSDRYARIDGPQPLDKLGVPDGYGWYHIRFPQRAASRGKIAAFGLTDRGSLFLNDQKPRVLGDGPGASGRVASLSLKAGEHRLTVLADNMGKPIAGFDLATPKGLWDHLYEIAPVSCETGVESLGPVDILDERSPIEGVHRGDATHPNRIVWSFVHRKKTPIFLRMDVSDWTGLVRVNGETVASFTPGSPVSMRFDAEDLNRGKNTIELAVMGDDAEADDAYGALKKSVALWEGVSALTEKADWFFAAWVPPADESFEDVAKSGLTGSAAKARRGSPTWWRCAFDPVDTDTGLRIDLRGMSKGQVLINGTNAARYWASTPDGNAVGPATEVWIAPDMLNADSENVLTIFDEHGFSPAKVAAQAAPLA